MKKHEVLENKMCKELEIIEEKYRSGAEMSEADLKKVDMLAHALKSLATYEAMKEASEMQSYRMNSYESNPYANSYGRQEMPARYPYYPEPRHW